MPTVPAQIGPYTITREIGRGGMGVVYLARDTKLDRDVAIKALPNEVVQNADRLARFDREAKTLAALNHPNIAQIYGFDEVDDRQYLILEYVPGETLDERLRRGAIPLAEALAIAQQVAEALEAAHEQGIIHRDLKPANIKLINGTDRSTVKVLDFGLAKSMTDATPSPVHDSLSPTVAPEHSPTIAGVVLGTAGYLSPEQARGRPADHRSDVFSFGCVLYEMLTGVRPFAGDSVADCIGAALHKEVDLSRLPPELPPSVRHLLRRCFAKDRRQRLQSIGDARLELEECAGDGAIEIPGSHVPTLERRLAALLGVLVLVLACVIGYLLWGLDRNAPITPTAATRWTISLAEGSRISLPSDAWFDYSRLIAVGPDGTIAFTARDRDGEVAIYIKRPGDHQPTALPGTRGGRTQGGRAAFFSPDGHWLGYFGGGRSAAEGRVLFKVPLAGGSPQEICDVPETATFDAAWSPDSADSFIVFSTDDGLWRVPASGSEPPTQLTVPSADDGEIGHHMPSFTPDGHGVLFTISTMFESPAAGEAGRVPRDLSPAAATPESRVAWFSFETGSWRTVIDNATQGQIIGDDQLLYARGGELMLTRLVRETMQPIGESDSVIPGVYTTPGLGGVVVTQFAVAADGTLAYVPAAAVREDDQLVWVEPVEGKPDEPRVEVITSGPGTWVHPRLSPDGNRVSVDRHTDDGMRDVYIYDMARNHLPRLTWNGVTWESEWHEDGDRLAIMSAERAGRWGMFVIRPDFMDEPRLVAEGDQLIPANWLNDNEVLAYDLGVAGIINVRLEGEPKRRTLLATRRHERFPRVSPDGEWMAFVGDESGQRQVFVLPYPSLDPPAFRVTGTGGGEPVWSRDGSTLYYRQGEAMFAADLSFEPSLTVTETRLLFRGSFDDAIVGHQHYDIALEGEKFLMIKHGEITGPSEVRVIMNWTDDVTGN